MTVSNGNQTVRYETSLLTVKLWEIEYRIKNRNSRNENRLACLLAERVVGVRES